LCDHSVSYFVRPILEHRDRAAVEYLVYATGQRVDGVTQRMRELADGWRDVPRSSDAQFIEQVRGDGIDVVIELSGQTYGNRLMALRLRGAPIQMTYIGYPNTTGVSAIDYRIVDSLTDPGADERATERLIRLDPCFLCYWPGDDSAPVSSISPPPCLRNGYITFGSFNSVRKFSPSTLGLWARLVRETAGSRLIIKSGTGLSGRGREHLYRQLEILGVERGRVDVLDRVGSRAAHLEVYGQVDIALDTYPYNGTTTTCEALYQGVPVVSLVGELHASRVGLTILSCVGLGELAASSGEEFVGAAKALSADLDRLSSLRTGLRERMQGSALCDGRAYCRRFEAALRAAWRKFCS
jgi:predicted O-linked N-acetylglucosamine transferase (SPINDLY family)